MIRDLLVCGIVAVRLPQQRAKTLYAKTSAEFREVP